MSKTLASPNPPPDDAGDLKCPECGYNLRGIDSARCPECGLAIDRAAMGRSTIPWSHRRQIGRFRAYWRTLGLAIFGIQKLAADMDRPVSYADAQRFRWVTIALIFLPPAIGGGLWIWRASEAEVLGVFANSFALPDSLVSCGMPLLALGFLLFLAAITGIPSYFFHPKRLPVVQQNKAIALSYYASAALLPAFWSTFMLAVVVFESSEGGVLDRRWPVASGLLVTLAISVIICMLAFLRNTSVLLRETTASGVIRRLVAAMIQCASVLVLGPVLLFLFPWLCGFVVLLVRR